jgi:hypothetical protein
MNGHAGLDHVGRVRESRRKCTVFVKRSDLVSGIIARMDAEDLKEITINGMTYTTNKVDGALPLGIKRSTGEHVYLCP